jgi:hypothetical protein
MRWFMKKAVFTILLLTVGIYLYRYFTKIKTTNIHFKSGNADRIYSEKGVVNFRKLNRKIVLQGERFYTYKFTYPWILQFKINYSEMKSIENYLAKLAKMSLSTFNLRGDENDLDVRIWHIIYSKIYKRSKKVAVRLAKIFRIIKKQHKMNDLQCINSVVRFIQYLKYKRPGGNFDFYTPQRALYDEGKGGRRIPDIKNNSGWHGAGDCDTKTVLLMLVLSELGYKNVMFHSLRYKHAMIGIAAPGLSGDYKEINGIKYYFTETTYPGWRIGRLPVKYSDKDYWIPMSFQNTPEGRINNYYIKRKTNRKYRNENTENQRFDIDGEIES